VQVQCCSQTLLPPNGFNYSPVQFIVIQIFIVWIADVVILVDRSEVKRKVWVIL